jgi:hypothetical protein
MTSPTTTTEFRTPSADELDRYRRDGYLVVRGLVPSEVLDAAERGMERFYAGDTDRPFPGSTRYDHYDWSPADGPGLRKNDYTSRMVDELAGLVGWPGIGAFAAGLSGSQGIRLWHDQLLFKPPSAGGGVAAVGWHTDRQYWQTCSTAEMLTCWVPSTTATPPSAGCPSSRAATAGRPWRASTSSTRRWRSRRSSSPPRARRSGPWCRRWRAAT